MTDSITLSSMDVLLKMASQMEALEKKIGDGDVADDEDDGVDYTHDGNPFRRALSKERP